MNDGVCTCSFCECELEDPIEVDGYDITHGREEKYALCLYCAVSLDSNLFCFLLKIDTRREMFGSIEESIWLASAQG